MLLLHQACVHFWSILKIMLVRCCSASHAYWHAALCLFELDSTILLLPQMCRAFRVVLLCAAKLFLSCCSADVGPLLGWAGECCCLNYAMLLLCWGVLLPHRCHVITVHLPCVLLHFLICWQVFCLMSFKHFDSPDYVICAAVVSKDTVTYASVR